MFQCCFLQEQDNVLNNHSGWQTNAENTGAILTFEIQATVNFPWPSRLHPLQPLCCLPRVTKPVCSYLWLRQHPLSSSRVPTEGEVCTVHPCRQAHCWHGAFSAVSICPGLLMLLLGPVYGGLLRTPSPSSSSCPL